MLRLQFTLENSLSLNPGLIDLLEEMVEEVWAPYNRALDNVGVLVGEGIA